MGALISATISDSLGHVFVSMHDLTNDVFSTIKDTNLILRKSIDLNTDALLYRQIRHKLLNLDLYQMHNVFFFLAYAMIKPFQLQILKGLLINH